MTVAELIEELKRCDPDAPVFVAWEYGDHANTTAATKVTSAETGWVREWPYGRCHKVLEYYEDPKDDDIDAIVIS